MDPRLLDYYNRELGYFRQLGGEFAEQFPKVAARLGMKGIEVADPYVERLLEGAAFLGARVQLKLDAEFPRFSQRLLEVVYPNYLAPTPATAIVRFAPKLHETALGNGFAMPRGTVLRAGLAKGEQTACEFRTDDKAVIAISAVQPEPARLQSWRVECGFVMVGRGLGGSRAPGARGHPEEPTGKPPNPRPREPANPRYP